MCKLISWIEKNYKNYFLTGKQVYESPTGEALKKWSSNIEEDKTGHGAIRFYYELEGGRERECTNFSTPDNFPADIVLAIKNGEMRGMGTAKGLLLPALDEDYQAKRKPLYEDYQAKRKPLDEDYQAKRNALDGDYQAKRKPLDEDYQAKCKPLDEDYQAKCKPLYEDYQAKRKPLDEDYQAKCKPLYDKFWDLFADPANRAEAWR
jgi:hypothetical protein